MIVLNKSVSYKASYYKIISYKKIQHYPSFTLRTAIMNEEAIRQNSQQTSQPAINHNNNQNLNQSSSQESPPSFDSAQSFADIYQSSIDNREQFWAEQAKRIYWHKEPEQTLDDSNLPFAKWFVGGESNLCYNCVDRHLAERAEPE